jgi:hypothetical protein
MCNRPVQGGYTYTRPALGGIFSGPGPPPRSELHPSAGAGPVAHHATRVGQLGSGVPAVAAGAAVSHAPNARLGAVGLGWLRGGPCGSAGVGNASGQTRPGCSPVGVDRRRWGPLRWWRPPSHWSRSRKQAVRVCCPPAPTPSDVRFPRPPRAAPHGQHGQYLRLRLGSNAVRHAVGWQGRKASPIVLDPKEDKPTDTAQTRHRRRRSAHP